MRIGTNIAAYMAGGQLNTVEKKLSASMNRLASGYKINTSKDDPAGMAMTQKLRTQIRALDRSSMNASDGMSVTQTAEGALAEVEAMIQRMRELAVQGASDSYTDEDRKNIQSEIDQLSKEIDRVSTDTQFNNMNLLDGTFERRVYGFDSSDRMTSDVEALYVSDSVPAGDYTIDISGGKIDTSDAAIQAVFGTDAIVTEDGNKVTISGSDGFQMMFALNNSAAADQTIRFEVTDIGRMPIQVGANEDQQIMMDIPCVNSKTLAIDDVDCTTSDSCGNAISKFDRAISFVSSVRGQLGAYENRLDNTSENITEAVSRIADTNMAEEMTDYTTYNVLQQAGISMVSQANQLPEKVLQLLQ